MPCQESCHNYFIKSSQESCHNYFVFLSKSLGLFQKSWGLHFIALHTFLSPSMANVNPLSSEELPRFTMATNLLLATSSNNLQGLHLGALTFTPHLPESSKPLDKGKTINEDSFKDLTEGLPMDTFDFTLNLAQEESLTSTAQLGLLHTPPLNSPSMFGLLLGASTSLKPKGIPLVNLSFSMLQEFSFIISNSLEEFSNLQEKLDKVSNFLTQLKELLEHQKAPVSLQMKPLTFALMTPTKTQALFNAKVTAITIQYQLHTSSH